MYFGVNGECYLNIYVCVCVVFFLSFWWQSPCLWRVGRLISLPKEFVVPFVLIFFLNVTAMQSLSAREQGTLKRKSTLLGFLKIILYFFKFLALKKLRRLKGIDDCC